MKKRKTLSKILASCASIAVLVGSLSMNVFAAESQYVGYDVQSNGFNVYGIGSNGNQIKTTFGNHGYNTYISVNGNNKDRSFVLRSLFFAGCAVKQLQFGVSCDIIDSISRRGE